MRADEIKMTEEIYPSETKSMHERLGVNRDSTQDEIKKAYRELALAWHPDRNPENRERAHIEFIAVSEAYENLCGDKVRRVFKEPGRSSERPKEGTYEYYSEMFDKIFKDFSLSSKASSELKVIFSLFKEFTSF